MRLGDSVSLDDLSLAVMSRFDMLSPEEYDALCRSECFVCAIVAGQRQPTEVVYEDESVIAFLNHFPTQDGYTLVCPKRHAERFEVDLTRAEWLHLQDVVQSLAAAVSRATGAIRVYLASLGSPERNAHLHVHVCPCPPGTPVELQQFEAMRSPDGMHHTADAVRQREIAGRIREALRAPQPDAGRPALIVRPLLDEERSWLRERLKERWGSASVVSRGTVHDAGALPGLVCVSGGERLGVATFAFSADGCEVCTLDAFEPGRGVGTALLHAVAREARLRGARRVWLITTNDNMAAVRFYQRRGLRLVSVHAGAVDAARRLKPTIPELGNDEIPIHDEIELELALT